MFAISAPSSERTAEEKTQARTPLRSPHIDREFHKPTKWNSSAFHLSFNYFFPKTSAKGKIAFSPSPSAALQPPLRGFGEKAIKIASHLLRAPQSMRSSALRPTRAPPHVCHLQLSAWSVECGLKTCTTSKREFRTAVPTAHERLSCEKLGHSGRIFMIIILRGG